MLFEDFAQVSKPSKQEVFEGYKHSKIIGFEAKIEGLIRLFRSKSYPNSILISGEYGIGKSSAVRELIKRYLDFDNLEAHPDVFILNSAEKEAESPGLNVMFKNKIKVEKVSGLIDFCYRYPSVSDKKFIIIDHADFLSINVANFLLKTLEEPPLNSIIFLISHNPQSIIQTIRSRLVEVKFTNLTQAQCAEVLAINGQEVSHKTQEIANFSPGLSILLHGLKVENIVNQLQKNTHPSKKISELKKTDINIVFYALQYILKTKSEVDFADFYANWAEANSLNLNNFLTLFSQLALLA
jgi:DNA polymerase-3 subunit delta'